MTVEKLRKQEPLIKHILEEYPETRGDDFLLYAEVIREYNPELLTLSAGSFLVGHSHYNVPNIKSVERVRRRLQAKYPELTSPKAKAKRSEEEQAYIGYAVEG